MKALNGPWGWRENPATLDAHYFINGVSRIVISACVIYAKPRLLDHPTVIRAREELFSTVESAKE